MRRLPFLLLAFATVACSGSQRTSDSDWTPDPQPKDKRSRETDALNAAQIDPIDTRHLVQIGVRHDLMLSPAPHQARCNCLAVEVGSARESKFFWIGSPPDTGTESLAVAVGSRGVACPDGDPDDRRRRPSISAVDRDGEDVILEVEDLPEGRPLASGAVIPKPGLKGGIYIRPHRNNRIYARESGTARCKVR